MTNDKRMEQEFEDFVLGCARESRLLLDEKSPQEQTALLRELIEASDVFFTVFPDPEAPRGFSIQLVKGEARLAKQQHDNVTQGHHFSAIFTSCIEEALAMRNAFGDGKAAH